MVNKHLNYGFDKSEFTPDMSRMNLDYLMGLIHTDGCIRNNRKSKPIVIAQSHIKFIKALKEWVEKNYQIVGNICMEGKQIAFNKNFSMLILNRKIMDYDSYYAGIIDGDGSFCSHISSSGTYWRFSIGSSKERKIKIFKELFDYFKLKPIIWKNNKCKIFGIQKVDELLIILNKIGSKLIIKQFAGDKVLSELRERKKNLIGKCIYCEKDFERKLIKGLKVKFVCDDFVCRKRYNHERKTKYWKNKSNCDKNLLNNNKIIKENLNLMSHNRC